MKKRMVIEVVFDTQKENDFIEKVMKKGIYRSLDTEPYYISAPQNVKSIDIKISDFTDIFEIGDNIITTGSDATTGVKEGEHGIVISMSNGYPRVLYKGFVGKEQGSRIFYTDPKILKKVSK